MTTLLAMDGGQTGTRARLIQDGRIVGEEELGPIRNDMDVVPQLADHAATICRDFGSADLFATGTTGLTNAATAADLLALVHPLGIRKVYLAHDSISSYLGALGDHPGVVTAAGTGVVTLALGETSMARVDGWGNIMGDAGSGYWIGRAGLDAGMRAYDGRGPHTRMLDLMLAEYPDIEDAYVVVQADPMRISRVAAYARQVLEFAAEGDEVCVAIARGAAHELALSAATGLTRVGETSQPKVCCLGGIFRSKLVADGFADEMENHFPDVHLRQPLGTGLDGAALLPELAERHPLLAKVDIAEV